MALEAAAAGKPTVASDVGGLRDIVADGETGFLVPPGDRAALAAAMQRLIADEDLRLRLGTGAKERAATFSSEAVIPRFEAAYELAIAERRQR